MLQRILALDVGDKRIGVAVSDPLGITAQGLETFVRTGDIDKDVAHILALLKKYEPVKLLFGLPRNMDGSYGFQSEKVRAFADAVLAKWQGEHDFYDERLTTVSAERVLMQAELNWRERRKVVDKVAAVVILQGYLENQSRKREQ
ncbi:MAG: Holliday junction resolvase RuvX [Bacillota bacterium]